MNGFEAVLITLAVVLLYWTPTIVAAVRKVPNVGSVAVINGLLGWTFVGWAVALSMACRSTTVPVTFREARDR